MNASLQSIFNRDFTLYAQSHELHVREWRAASAIMRCRTPALGGRVLACEQGHYQHTQFNSCRHRSCPRCADAPRQRWVQWQLQRLLPCEHFHAVFTLPHVFLPLWAYNRAWLNATLLRCVRECVLQLCADPRHLGATPGLLLALHTWGRDLSQHPHVHALISAGGLNPHGQWRASRSGYLVPVKAASALFRGKMLSALSEALHRQRLALPAPLPAAHWLAHIRSQWRKHWNVQLQQRYAHGRGVALYLARYVKGGPLPADRPLQLQRNAVVLPYTDHRDGRAKRARFNTAHFIERVLWHAAPRGQHLVRHAGLYASAASGHHRRCMQLLSPAPIPAPLPATAFAATPQACPRCRATLQPLLSLLPVHRVGEVSIQAPATTERRLGPTPSSSGNPPAGHSQALRRRSLRRRIPLN